MVTIRRSPKLSHLRPLFAGTEPATLGPVGDALCGNDRRGGAGLGDGSGHGSRTARWLNASVCAACGELSGRRHDWRAGRAVSSGRSRTIRCPGCVGVADFGPGIDQPVLLVAIAFDRETRCRAGTSKFSRRQRPPLPIRAAAAWNWQIALPLRIIR